MPKSTLKILVIICLSVLINISCNRRLSKISQFEALKLTTDYPVVLLNGNIPHLRDTVSLIFLKNYNLMSIPYEVTKQRGDSLVTDKILYDNFLFKNGDKTGYFLFLDSSRRIIKMPVDSIITVHGHIIKQQSSSLDSLIPLPKLNNNNITVWRYAIPGESSEFSIDTIYYYFDKNLLKSKFSFWKSLDSLAGSKLFKMSFVYNSKWSDSLHKILPAREILFEFHIDSSIKKKEAKYRLDSLLERIRLEFPNDQLEN